MLTSVIARIHEDMCRPLHTRTLGSGREGSQGTGEGPQGALIGALYKASPSRLLSIDRGGILTSNIYLAFSLVVHVTKGALHFFGHQARNLMQPHQSPLFFLPFYPTLMAGRQAGRRTGKAGIVHFFAISFYSLGPSFFFIIFYPAFYFSSTSDLTLK
jgi:hypothetical protein